MSSVYSISSSADFKALIEEMKSKKEGQGMFKDNGFTYYVVYKRLPTFGWSIAEVKSYSELLVGSSTLDTLRTNMIVLVILAVIASFIVISLIAESITRPLNELTDVANKLSVGEMNVALPVIKSKDEVYYLGEAIRSTQAAIEQLMGECYKRNSPKKEKKK
jgi:methyl-accepting chemotaxis protein